MKKSYVFGVGAVLTACLLSSPALADNARHENHGRAKNIIFMVPDGMGLSDVTAARIFKNGPNGDRLSFETMSTIGYQSTHAANATVTDSSSAAAAWAVGEKFNNGEVSCHAEDGLDCANAPKTILELAKAMGKATGLVATSQISHATPAAFGAHTFSRDCGVEIARQYIEETGVDVILGGGVYRSKPMCDAPYPLSVGLTQEDIVASAQSLGYGIAGDKDGLEAAVTGKTDKLLGMFTPFNAGKTVEMFRVDPTMAYPAAEPTLAEMTDAALDILEHDRDGMFLVVEGSQIDWENHANNAARQLAEMLGFEEAVQVVRNWVAEKKSRMQDTLVVVVADHETGGHAINGPGNRLSEAGEIVTAGWTTTDHTATDTIIWAQGPGSESFGRALDNTNLFWLMIDAMKK
ncbi:MAG: alkaline phosphatase [Thermodesulfobacteriota bacterium]